MSRPTSPAAALSDVGALVRRRADHTPDATAYRFLHVDRPPDEITYTELERRSARLGARLAAATARGDRVLLMLPPGIDYVAALCACFRTGRVAVPAYPPDPRRAERSLPRLERICDDAAAVIALTSGEVPADLRTRYPHLGATTRLAIDVNDDPGDATGPADARPHDVAALHYTSGSTSSPKAIVLQHENLLANLEHIRHSFAMTPETRGVFWLPPYHDMGLIGAILAPLYVGYPSVLLSPLHFLARPVSWLEAIARYRATLSGGPNFAYDLCVGKTTPEQREQLDLGSWTAAFNGAEPVRAATLRRFATAFAPAGFRARAFVPCYGLAEATLLVSSAPIDGGARTYDVDRAALGAGRVEPGDTPLVSSGRPADGVLVAVVDPATSTAVSEKTVGEVWVCGPNVATGYWRRRDDPAFTARLPEYPGRRFLRTGDLGALVDGELLITGRAKDVIIVRGRNVYPQDLELAAERAHPAVRPGGSAAFAEDELTGDGRITLVCEIAPARLPVDIEALGRAVRRSVAEHCDVAISTVVAVAAGGVPKTSSGKLRRGACRDQLRSGRLVPLGVAHAHPWPTEPPALGQIQAATGAQRVALIRELVLSLAARRGSATPPDATSMLDLVGDSLQAMEIGADLHAALGVEVRLEQLLGAAKLTELANDLADRLDAVRPPSRPVDPGALSDGQRALWLLQRLAPTSSAYHLSVALRLNGRLDADAVALAVDRMAARHPLLRVRVAVDAGGPRFVDTPAPELVRIRLADGADVDELISTFVHRPFDMERGALWRSAWLDGPAPVLVVCVHHMIADYPSLHVILDDLERALRHGTLPSRPHGPAELVAHEAGRHASPAGDRHRCYWADQLADLPVLDLPTPGPRPVRPTHRGTQHEITIPPATVAGLRALAQAERTTLPSVLLAGLHALLLRWTDQQDIVIGTPVSARRVPWAADVVGYCVNALPIRAHPRHDRPFDELVREVRDTVLAAVAHELPFPSVVAAAGGARDASRNPVFQALFAFEAARGDERDGILAPPAHSRVRFADVDAEPVLIRPVHVPFDLAVYVEQTELGLTAAVQVGHDALPGDTAARLADHWVRLLGCAARRPWTPIGGLELLSAAEHHFVVHTVNPQAAAPQNECLHTLVARQARRTPDADAVIDGHTVVSYRELVEWAAAIAGRLLEAGIGPEQRVGLHTTRGVHMVAAMLGVLGAGAAYVYL